MKIQEALEIVEEAKNTAEKIICRVFNTESIGFCENIEVRSKETIYCLFRYTSQCGDCYDSELEIPEKVLDNPTKENIEEFITAYNKAEKEKKIQKAANKKAEKEKAAIKAKKKRFERYQKLKEEFSSDKKARE